MKYQVRWKGVDWLRQVKPPKSCHYDVHVWSPKRTKIEWILLKSNEIKLASNQENSRDALPISGTIKQTEWEKMICTWHITPWTKNNCALKHRMHPLLLLYKTSWPFLGSKIFSFIFIPKFAVEIVQRAHLSENDIPQRLQMMRGSCPLLYSYSFTVIEILIPTL